jgi:hypothetical protein
MKRRELIAGISAAGWPLLVRAQQQTKPTRSLGDRCLNMPRGFAGVWRRSAFQWAAT